jgi:hypothetical protein
MHSAKAAAIDIHTRPSTAVGVKAVSVDALALVAVVGLVAVDSRVAALVLVARMAFPAVVV